MKYRNDKKWKTTTNTVTKRTANVNTVNKKEGFRKMTKKMCDDCGNTTEIEDKERCDLCGGEMI